MVGSGIRPVGLQVSGEGWLARRGFPGSSSTFCMLLGGGALIVRATGERKSGIAITVGAGSCLLLLLLSFPFGPPLSCAGPARAQCELASRGFAGFVYRNITDADKDSLKEYLDLMTSAARGDSLPAILRRNPALGKYVNKDNRIMDDRTVEYWRGQLNINLSQIYGQVTEPVLIIYAASDFITQLACHEHIRDVLLLSGNSDVTLTVVPGTDHAYAFARDKRESYDDYKTRNFKGNPEAMRQITEWLAKHAN